MITTYNYRHKIIPIHYKYFLQMTIPTKKFLSLENELTWEWISIWNINIYT